LEPSSSDCSGLDGVICAAFITSAAIALPRDGGTEFPTCRNPCHFVTWVLNQSG
jgi:hypothetical protein